MHFKETNITFGRLSKMKASGKIVILTMDFNVDNCQAHSKDIPFPYTKLFLQICILLYMPSSHSQF